MSLNNVWMKGAFNENIRRRHDTKRKGLLPCAVLLPVSFTLHSLYTAIDWQHRNTISNANSTRGTIPSNSPEATLHEWSGDGFSYTSKNLGITVEFPPEWENLMTISDDITYEYFVEGQSEPLNCVTLKAIHGGENGEIPIAYIYWRAADDHGPEADYGECVTLVEREGNVCLCWMPMNTKIGLELLEDTALYDEYDIVEQGILSGEYEIELLDLERDLSELAFDDLDMNAPVGLDSTLRLKMMILSFFTGLMVYFATIYQRKKSFSAWILLKYPGQLAQFRGLPGRM